MGPPPPECCATPECKSGQINREAYRNPECTLPYDLNALGWREGENLWTEARWSFGDPARLPALAAELVALRPDILVASATIETKAFQAATSDIPIVFTVSTDPVGSGIVDSLARPGRNATGMSLTPQILWGKRLELIAGLIGHRPTKVTWLGSPGDIMFKRSLADPGCVKTLRGIIAPGILGSVVMRRAIRRKNLSSARHYDQIRFRFRTTKTRRRHSLTLRRSIFASQVTRPGQGIRGIAVELCVASGFPLLGKCGMAFRAGKRLQVCIGGLEGIFRGG
jgi:ABC transporter substrate binding protein